MITGNKFQGELYTLQASDGTSATVTSYGARLVSLLVPACCGRLVDVVLGHATLDAYRNDRATYFGAIVGRYANRIANGRLSVGGRDYDLSRNEANTTLHGGSDGFDNRNWHATQEEPHALRLRLASPDGDQGFPGNLAVEVVYTLEYRALRIEYAASTDAPTVVNLTNHSSFNLAGEGAGDITDHILGIQASHYTPVDQFLIPTGAIAPVAGTPFDLRTPCPIALGLRSLDPQITIATGYDHNFVLDGGRTSEPRPVCRLFSPRSGLAMTVLTTEPGLQLYTGNALEASIVGKSGKLYGRHGGMCLETQHFPDTPHHPAFPATVLRPGETYRSTTKYRFT